MIRRPILARTVAGTSPWTAGTRCKPCQACPFPTDQQEEIVLARHRRCESNNRWHANPRSFLQRKRPGRRCTEVREKKARRCISAPYACLRESERIRGTPPSTD